MAWTTTSAPMKALPSETESPAKAWTILTRPVPGVAPVGVAAGHHHRVLPVLEEAVHDLPADEAGAARYHDAHVPKSITILPSMSPSALTSKRALVVEDDPDIVELVSHYLAADGWSRGRLPAAAATALAEGALGELPAPGSSTCSCPDLDGLSICAELRRDPRTVHLPIVMLTARGDETDRVGRPGGRRDDYIVKPFSPKELVARVRSLFRRMDRKPDSDTPLTFRSWRWTLAAHRPLGGAPVRLTAKEFALLVALLEARGRVLSRTSLLEEVWGYSYAEGTRTVDVHVRRLREKLPELAPFHPDREDPGLPHRGRGLVSLGLRGRIVFAAMAATATALVAVLLLAGPGLERRALEHVRNTLLAEARLMGRVVEQPLAEGRPPDELDALVDGAARDVRARVTIIAPDGRVLADSSLSGRRCARWRTTAAGRRSRRRWPRAPAARSGTAPPWATTCSTAAVAIRHQGRLLGVSRVALSLRGVKEQASELQRAVTVALALAFVLTGPALGRALSPLAGPLNEVMDAARRFAQGDLHARSRVRAATRWASWPAS
jgi:DNA-binding response OmpR family regulator